MAKRELTEEQKKEIKILQANAKMLQKTKKEAEERGKDTKTIELIDIATNDVLSQMALIDEDSAKQAEQVREMSDKKEESVSNNLFVQNPASNQQYDIVALPSNGEGYKSKISRIPVAFLTAYDENLITSPSLYRDGLVIDCLLKSKIVNTDINPDELLSGDVDAIILFLRATSYGVEFPITVRDPKTGAQIDSVVDLSKLKSKDFKLKGDENGYFDFTLPLSKDVVKFKYLTRKEEKNLELVANLETKSANATMLSRNMFEVQQVIGKYKDELTTKEITELTDAVSKIENLRNKLNSSPEIGYNKIVTNRMEMNIVSVNGNTDRRYIHDYINSMRAKDSLELRKYINENEPGIDFTITVERPESLGGGSFETFLEWNDSVFLNIA